MCIGIKPIRMKRIKPRDLNQEVLNLIINGVRSDDVRSNLKMAAPVSNQKILNDDETVDGGLMARCRRGESADSEMSSDVSSDERFINKYVPPPRAFANSEENQDEGGKDRKPDYFHVSTPRGQATDSHSLAERERVRREKIGERMKYLQDLVPGCSKIMGKGERLDEIIEYVQSLDRQVEFLSTKWVVEIQWNLFWFVRNKEFYKTKGDTWKRVYWLFEPPDTDRSSLSAATANYLKLYTCDLDRTSIPSKLELKDTLLSIRERSSIVIKDFDFKNESTISLPDGEHTLSLSEKKIVRTLKRKCRSMSILSLEDHKQHVDRRWEDAAKSHGTKRICRQLVIHRLSTAKRIRRQHGIHQRPFQRSAIGLPDGVHILSLSEKKIVRKTLKRKCRSMSVNSLVDHQQHVDRRWEDAAKNIGAKSICRRLVILCVSIAKRMCRQHGIHHRWPFQQDRGTMKGYTLGDERPVEVIRLSTDGKLVSRLQVIYISWLGRFSPPISTLPGGEIVGHIALSSSQFATTNSIAQRVGQDQSSSASSDSENERTREQEDPEKMYTSITSDDLRRLYGRMNRKDAAASLGVSVATFKRKCREFGIKRWPHVRKKKVRRPPDQHGERNTSTACKTPLHNVHARMEGEPAGQNQEANEFRRDFMEHSIALNTENDSIIAVYSETEAARGSSKWAFQLEGQTMQSTTYPYRDDLVFSQSQIASTEVVNENMGSLQDRRDLLASQVVALQKEPLLEGHVFGFGNWTVDSCSDLASSQTMRTFSHATESSENLENWLASVEEHLMEENVYGLQGQILLRANPCVLFTTQWLQFPT